MNNNVHKRPFRKIFFNEELNCFEIEFDYNSDLVDSVKTIPGRKYNAQDKKWLIPIESSERLLMVANEHFLEIDKGALEVIYKDDAFLLLSSEVNYHGDRVFSSFKRQLRTYQKVAVEYMLKKKRTFNCDSMGAGKGFSSVAAVIEAKAFPCLIISPSSMVYTWKDEWDKTIDGHKIQIIKNGKQTVEKDADIVIMSYGLVKNFVKEEIGKRKKKIYISSFPLKLKSVIVDEFHMCKEEKSKRTQNVTALLKDVEYRFLLSGTPILNAHAELIAPLIMIDRIEDFGGKNCFMYKYCDAKPNRYKRFLLDLSGSCNGEELSFHLRKNCMVRRQTKQVIEELPDLQRNLVKIDLDNRKEYDLANEDFENYVLGLDLDDEAKWRKIKSEALVKIGVLRQVSSKGKIDQTKELIQNILENKEKVIVFCEYTDTIHKLKEEFTEALIIDGSVDQKKRKEYIDRFQNNTEEDKIIICNTKAAGVGITLTAASKIVVVELPWTPAELEQAEARAFRMGQKNNVNVYIVLGENTIDEGIYKLIGQKKEVFNQVTASVDTFSTEVVRDLLKSVKEKKIDKA